MEAAVEISQSDGKITVTLSLSVADFARALADGELRLRFDAGAAVQLDEGGNAALAAVCGRAAWRPARPPGAALALRRNYFRPARTQ